VDRLGRSLPHPLGILQELSNTLHHTRADTQLPADLEDPVPPLAFSSRIRASTAGWPSLVPFALARTDEVIG
jgi:hypothetical protein